MAGRACVRNEGEGLEENKKVCTSRNLEEVSGHGRDQHRTIRQRLNPTGWKMYLS